MISTVPVPGGDVAVIEVAESAVMVPGLFDPKSTAEALPRSVPVMVTLVLPDGEPESGLTPVTATVGAAAVMVVLARGVGAE